MIRTFVMDEGRLVESPGLEAAHAILESKHTYCWVDASPRDEAELQEVARTFGLHPLVVEDIRKGRQRPKLEPYPDHYAIVFYAVSVGRNALSRRADPEPNQGAGRIHLHQISMLLGANYLVTVHAHAIPEIESTLDTWRKPAPTDRPTSLAYLLYTLLDGVVDSYFSVLDHFESDLDSFEEALFRNAPLSSVAQLFSVRRELLSFRRIVGPERDVVNEMLRHDSPVANRAELLFYQDLYDHLLRITDSIDLYRDMVAGALDGYLSVQSNTLNVTVQRLTSWSIILMSMGLFFGFWGMNFVDMPELQLPLGHLGALVLAVAVGGGLFTYFRRRGWL